MRFGDRSKRGFGNHLGSGAIADGLRAVLECRGPPPRRIPEMSTADPTADHACDVLVIGSGAGGLATAVTAAKLGLSALVVEKESVFGGTTARSGGWLWIPCNGPSARDRKST